MASILWFSGLNKFQDMEAAKILYEAEFNLLGTLPVNFLFYFSTYLELIGSVLIALGLFTRLISFPLLFIVLITQFYGTYANEHYFWMFTFVGLILHGPGNISLDCFIRKKYGCNI